MEIQQPRLVWGDISVGMNAQGQLVVTSAGTRPLDIIIQGSFARDDVHVSAAEGGVAVRLNPRVEPPAAMAPSTPTFGAAIPGVQQATFIGNPLSTHGAARTIDDLKALQTVLKSFSE